MSPFRVVDHTADIAVIIEGRNEEALLLEGIRTLFFLLTERILEGSGDSKNRQVRKRFRIEFESFETLFIDFLNAVIAAVDMYGLLPVGASVKLREKSAVISVRFARQGLLKREIKAATHHDYSIVRTPKGLRTKVTFDV